MKEIYLKPCPYCGGVAFIDVFPTGTPYINAHHTKKCDMKPCTWLLAQSSLKKQIKAWNMRKE